MKSIIAVVMTDLALGDGASNRIIQLCDRLSRASNLRYVAICSQGNVVTGWRSNRVGLCGMVSVFARSLFEIAVRRPDVLLLFSFGNVFNPFIALFAKLFGISIVYDCQDPPVEISRALYGSNLATAIIPKAIEFCDPLLARCVDVTFSVSPGLDEILRSRGWNAPIYRIYNLPANDPSENVEYAQYRLPSEWAGARVLIYAGGIQPKIRGLEMQLEGLSLGRKRGLNIKLFVAGWGDRKPFLNLAKALGIGQHVVFSPPLPRHVLQSALMQCDFAVVDTLYYALPTKVFEYVSRGVYLLCSAQSRDVADAFSGLCAVYDGSPESLVHAIATMGRKRASTEKIRELFTGFQRTNDKSIAEALKRIN